MSLAASLVALATTTLASPADPFHGYARCSARCAASDADAYGAPCKTWDWDPTTDTCHFSSSSSNDQRVREAPVAASPPPSPTLQKLIAKYAALQNASCAKVLLHEPSLNADDVAAFMVAYQQHTNETEVIAAARKLMTPQLNAFLSLPDSILSPDGLDTAMVRCAVLHDAGSGLAEFAVLGAGMEATVDQLLADTVLMRDLLVAGGAAGGNYGQAAAIYADICFKYPEHCQPATAAPVAAMPTLAAKDDGCTFKPHCDYSKGSRDNAPAATQAACCALCTARAGCAAGVFDGKKCWFKTGDEVEGGCHPSSRSVAACVPKNVKPPPTPPPPPPPTPAPPLPPTPPTPPGSFWDDRSPTTALRRLAVAMAAKHASPIRHRSASTINGTRVFDNVDPLVRYGNMASQPQVLILLPFLSKWLASKIWI